MRKVLYVVILALLFAVPLERADVAKLLPIRAVALYTDGPSVILETDGAHTGTGEDVTQALSNLKQKTPALVYLDTAQYLLVSEEAVSYVEELGSLLKPSVKVCVCEAAGRVQETAEYLEVHGNLPKLKQWQQGKTGM